MNDSIDQQPSDERRSRITKEIKQLISERNEVLSMYCNLAGCDGSNKTKAEDISPDDLQDFCQLLIDYIASGHFELYRRISEGEERRKDIVKLANVIYPRIEKTTQTAVNFNDVYIEKNISSSKSLVHDLSKLGEDLATRIELEDQLINTILAPKPEAEEVLQ